MPLEVMNEYSSNSLGAEFAPSPVRFEGTASLDPRRSLDPRPPRREGNALALALPPFRLWRPGIDRGYKEQRMR